MHDMQTIIIYIYIYCMLCVSLSVCLCHGLCACACACACACVCVCVCVCLLEVYTGSPWGFVLRLASEFMWPNVLFTVDLFTGT